nr:MAG TPA: Head Tail Connector Protein [Caudoviricetes sp.]
MAYLTFDEYSSISTTVIPEHFSDLEQQAEYAIDDATHDYYQLNSLTDDRNQRRVHDFKRAVAEQINYYAFVGSTKSYEQESEDFKSVKIGRLELDPNSSVASTTKQGLCRESYQLLGKHGLLYRGVS